LPLDAHQLAKYVREKTRLEKLAGEQEADTEEASRHAEKTFGAR
jgi:hypothetical protein